MPVGSTIFNFNYTDRDHGENARATFNMSAFQDDFSDIQSTFKLYKNGSLELISAVDVNKKPSYVVFLFVLSFNFLA